MVGDLRKTVSGPTGICMDRTLVHFLRISFAIILFSEIKRVGAYIGESSTTIIGPCTFLATGLTEEEVET